MEKWEHNKNELEVHFVPFKSIIRMLNRSTIRMNYPLDN